MIEIVDKIPAGTPTQRELIRRDINEAIKKSIRLFEIKGENYRINTLADNARQVADRANRYIRRSIANQKNVSYLETPKDTIIIIKRTIDGIPHVYCRINYANLEISGVKEI